LSHPSHPPEIGEHPTILEVNDTKKSEQDDRKNSSRENTNPHTQHAAQQQDNATQHSSTNSTVATTAQALDIPPSVNSQLTASPKQSDAALQLIHTQKHKVDIHTHSSSPSFPFNACDFLLHFTRLKSESTQSLIRLKSESTRRPPREMTQTQSEDNRKNSSRESTNPHTLHDAEKKQPQHSSRNSTGTRNPSFILLAAAAPHHQNNICSTLLLIHTQKHIVQIHTYSSPSFPFNACDCLFHLILLKSESTRSLIRLKSESTPRPPR
jgi:hypothetical protein